MQPREKRRSREPKLHKLADKFTEILIYFIIIFSTWAFGATEVWSIWCINISAYALFLLLVIKWITRLKTKYNIRTNSYNETLLQRPIQLNILQKFSTILLSTSMILLLIYIALCAINARASFNVESHEFKYYEEFNNNLPHSYDARGTWFLFWQYLGIVFLYWGTQDWLQNARRFQNSISLNPRLKRLLYLMCFNGGILAFECILQRIYYSEGNGKLLFLCEPSMNSPNNFQFGPFAYRSNATSYLNIIWPLSLGLFIKLGKENIDYAKRRIGKGTELLLIPFIILAASAPIISSARGGSLIMISLLVLVMVSILFVRIRSKFLRITIVLSLIAGLFSAYILGWDHLEPRLTKIFTDNMSNRIEIYEITMKMINEYGHFGSGPGSFEAISQFELNEYYKSWQSWVHNDYLEFYLTFGIIGGSILLLIVLAFILQILIKSNLRINIIKWFGILSLLGVFAHAMGDFPLQVLSILIPICLTLNMLTSEQA